MKRNEFKKILKPLIKECIRDILFEEGVLSNMISEVVVGLNKSQIITESAPRTRKPANKEISSKREDIVLAKKRLLDSIGKGSYNNVDLFEGTSPMPTTSQPGSSPMAGVSANDSGVDITKIPGMENWSALIK